jgi:hypothetical protein
MREVGLPLAAPPPGPFRRCLDCARETSEMRRMNLIVPSVATSHDPTLRRIETGPITRIGSHEEVTQ